jgi:phosphoserine aminotransferase
MEGKLNVMRVLVSDNLADIGIEMLRQAEGIDVDVNVGLSPEELKGIMKNYDALIIRSATRVTKEIIEAAPKLKVIARAGIGLDNVDIPTATKNGIVVMNTPEGNVVTTAEHTIKGTQWASFPDTGQVPIVCDMSSDIMSRPIDPAPFGLMYAGAQKNIGPAGVTLVIIRDDMVKRSPENLPAMLNYSTFSAKNSMFNTPPCLAIYACRLVLKWLEETIGGLDKMESINHKKAAILYDAIDENQFYRGTAEKESRSIMNITFRLPSEDLETEFVAQALDNGLGGLKGHRSVGGCRASIYNATGLDAVHALVEFMKEFAEKKG